jgi:hypothetical protein
VPLDAIQAPGWRHFDSTGITPLLCEYLKFGENGDASASRIDGVANGVGEKMQSPGVCRFDS